MINILLLVGVVFVLLVLAFIGLGLCVLFGRRERPGSCAHDPSEPHAPGQAGCEVCGGDAEKCDQNQR